jgi:hypothetical protein
MSTDKPLDPHEHKAMISTDGSYEFQLLFDALWITSEREPDKQLSKQAQPMTGLGTSHNIRTTYIQSTSKPTKESKRNTAASDNKLGEHTQNG